jgi:hypothetical protein
VRRWGWRAAARHVPPPPRPRARAPPPPPPPPPTHTHASAPELRDVQLTVPMAFQTVLTPIHLMALDVYNRPGTHAIPCRAGYHVVWDTMPQGMPHLDGTPAPLTTLRRHDSLLRCMLVLMTTHALLQAPQPSALSPAYLWATFFIL